MIIHSRALAALAATTLLTTLLTTLVAPLATAEADDAAPMTATAAAETIRLWPGDAPASRGTADDQAPDPIDRGSSRPDLGVRPYDAVKQLHPWTGECRRWLGAHGF